MLPEVHQLHLKEIAMPWVVAFLLGQTLEAMCVPVRLCCSAHSC